MLIHTRTIRDVCLNPRSASWVIVAALSLSACTSIENQVTDLISSSESRLPREAIAHQELSNEELMVFGQPGLKEFEIARRFEAGSFGFPIKPECALSFYRRSGATRTVLREDRAAGGANQPITYLGFPPARTAARRLEAEGMTVPSDETSCLSSVRRAVP